jgi:hypothetical protein
MRTKHKDLGEHHRFYAQQGKTIENIGAIAKQRLNQRKDCVSYYFVSDRNQIALGIQ